MEVDRELSSLNRSRQHDDAPDERMDVDGRRQGRVRIDYSVFAETLKRARIPDVEPTEPPKSNTANSDVDQRPKRPRIQLNAQQFSRAAASINNSDPIPQPTRRRSLAKDDLDMLMQEKRSQRQGGSRSSLAWKLDMPLEKYQVGDRSSQEASIRRIGRSRTPSPPRGSKRGTRLRMDDIPDKPTVIQKEATILQRERAVLQREQAVLQREQAAPKRKGPLWKLDLYLEKAQEKRSPQPVADARRSKTPSPPRSWQGNSRLRMDDPQLNQSTKRSNLTSRIDADLLQTASDSEAGTGARNARSSVPRSAFEAGSKLVKKTKGARLFSSALQSVQAPPTLLNTVDSLDLIMKKPIESRLRMDDQSQSLSRRLKPLPQDDELAPPALPPRSLGGSRMRMDYVH